MMPVTPCIATTRLDRRRMPQSPRKFRTNFEASIIAPAGGAGCNPSGRGSHPYLRVRCMSRGAGNLFLSSWGLA